MAVSRNIKAFAVSRDGFFMFSLIYPENKNVKELFKRIETFNPTENPEKLHLVSQLEGEEVVILVKTFLGFTKMMERLMEHLSLNIDPTNKNDDTTDVLLSKFFEHIGFLADLLHDFGGYQHLGCHQKTIDEFKGVDMLVKSILSDLRKPVDVFNWTLKWKRFQFLNEVLSMKIIHFVFVHVVSLGLYIQRSGSQKHALKSWTDITEIHNVLVKVADSEQTLRQHIDDMIKKQEEILGKIAKVRKRFTRQNELYVNHHFLLASTQDLIDTFARLQTYLVKLNVSPPNQSYTWSTLTYQTILSLKSMAVEQMKNFERVCNYHCLLLGVAVKPPETKHIEVSLPPEFVVRASNPNLSPNLDNPANAHAGAFGDFEESVGQIRDYVPQERRDEVFTLEPGDRAEEPTTSTPTTSAYDIDPNLVSSMNVLFLQLKEKLEPIYNATLEREKEAGAERRRFIYLGQAGVDRARFYTSLANLRAETEAEAATTTCEHPSVPETPSDIDEETLLLFEGLPLGFADLAFVKAAGKLRQGEEDTYGDSDSDSDDSEEEETIRIDEGEGGEAMNNHDSGGGDAMNNQASENREAMSNHESAENASSDVHFPDSGSNVSELAEIRELFDFDVDISDFLASHLGRGLFEEEEGEFDDRM